jgi:hypothetical protein
MTDRRAPTNTASSDADEDRSGSGALLGLEQPAPLDIEKAGQNSSDLTDLDSQPCYAPLLGTICSHLVENTGKSSDRRSPESVCYDKLLRENGPSSGEKFRKTVSVEGRDCYGKLESKVAFHRKCVRL